MLDETEKPLPERLQALAAFLDTFTQPGFEFGEWDTPEPTDFVEMLSGYYSLSAAASGFVSMAYEMGWVLDYFDWGEWMLTPEAAALRDDPAVMEQATPDQLAKLLTTVIRQERFVEGALGGAFESGLLTAIVRRAAVLANEHSSMP